MYVHTYVRMYECMNVCKRKGSALLSPPWFFKRHELVEVVYGRDLHDIALVYEAFSY
jgi:hypothetical protein